MEINLLRHGEAALPDVTATFKGPGFFARIRWYLRLCERNQPRGAACRYRTDPLTVAFTGLHFCVHRAGWQQERQNNRQNFRWPIGFGIRGCLQQGGCRRRQYRLKQKP